MALDEVLVFRVVPELLICAVLICSFVHVSIKDLLIELSCIVDEDIFFYSRKFHECVCCSWLLVEVVSQATLISEQLLLLSLT